MQSFKFGGSLEKYGVDFMRIKRDKNTDIMSLERDMTKEEKKIMQSMVDEMYDEFIDVVVDGRGMDEGNVRELADGRVYTGKQAGENGLVDEVGKNDDALAALEDDYDLTDSEVKDKNNNLD